MIYFKTYYNNYIYNMSLLALISYKNKQKRLYNPKIIEESFDDLLKDYNFDIDNSDTSDISINKTTITNIENNQRLKLEELNVSNSDVEEDSPFNDSEDEK